MDKKDNPMSRLMELAAPYKGEYVLSVILAILGVAAGLLPFFAVSKIVILLMDGETSVSVYMEWCLIAGIGFLGKVCFANFSTLVSHTAPYGLSLSCTFLDVVQMRLRRLSTELLLWNPDELYQYPSDGMASYLYQIQSFLSKCYEYLVLILPGKQESHHRLPADLVLQRIQHQRVPSALQTLLPD